MPKVLGIILAGGLGQRLLPLTQHRAKPGVPFGAKYRIIDFVLSNFINSGINSLYILIQFKCQSLVEHLRDGWMMPGIIKDAFVIPVPPQMLAGRNWYRGTADAIYQNIHLIERARPDLVAVFNADHVYHMDIRQMIGYHQEKQAELTVAAIPVPIAQSYPFGVLQTDLDGRITAHVEKPKEARPIPGQPERALVSMGNYIFSKQLLCDTLKKSIEAERYGLAADVMPLLAEERRAYAYDFRKNQIPGNKTDGESVYWRDIGTIESYYEAHMDLIAPQPSFNLYNTEWPLRTATFTTPPLKLVQDEKGRQSLVRDSILAGGTIIRGGEVRNSIIGRNVFVGSGCLIEDSVVLDNVHLARDVKVRRCIIDKNVILPAGTSIGYDPAEDSRKYFRDASGIVVVSSGPPNWPE